MGRCWLQSFSFVLVFIGLDDIIKILGLYPWPLSWLKDQCRKLLHYIVLWTSSFFSHTNPYVLRSLLCKSPSQNWLSSAIILISFRMTLSVNCKRPTPSSYVACSTSPLLPKHTLSTTFKVWHSYCCCLFDRLI